MTRSLAGSERGARPIPTVAFAGLLIGQLISLANATLVMTAAIDMMRDLRGSNIEYTWVLTSTILSMTIANPIWSRLADLHSPKRLLQVALGIFIAGSLVAGSAPNPGVLILGRCIQGVGIGGTMSLVLVVIGILVQARRRGLYTAWISGVQLVAMLAGPVAGGLLVQTPIIGWRGCFLIGIPLALVSMVLVQISLPTPERTAGRRRPQYRGVLAMGLGVSAGLVWLTFEGQYFELVSWPSILLMILTLVALPAAVILELRAQTPVLPLRLLSRRVILFAVIATAATGITGVAAPMLVTQYLQNGRGIAPAGSGLLLAAIAAGTLAASFVGGVVVARTGKLKGILLLGAVLLVGAQTAMIWVRADTSLVLLVALLVLQGAGLGATQQFFVVVVQNETSAADLGAATGLVSFIKSLATACGLAAAGALFDAQVEKLGQDGLDFAAAHAGAAAHTFIFAAIAGGIGLIVILLMPRVTLAASPAPAVADAVSPTGPVVGNLDRA